MGSPGSPGKSRKEGQYDQGEQKELRREFSLAVSMSPGPPGLPSGSFLGSLELPHGKCFQGDEDNVS